EQFTLSPPGKRLGQFHLPPTAQGLSHLRFMLVALESPPPERGREHALLSSACRVGVQLDLEVLIARPTRPFPFVVMRSPCPTRIGWGDICGFVKVNAAKIY